MRTIAEKFFENAPIAQSGCWLWQKGKNGHGYGQITIGRRQWMCHRLTWVMFRGEIPEHLCVLHRCDTPACINPDHLFLGTKADNAIDAARKGRARGRSALCDVSAIRRLRENGLSQDQIADQLGITQGQVSKVLNKKRRVYV